MPDTLSAHLDPITLANHSFSERSEYIYIYNFGMKQNKALPEKAMLTT